MPTVLFGGTPHSTACACRTHRDEDSAHRLPIVYYYTMSILDMRFPGEPVEERAIRPHTVVMGQLYCVRVLAMGDRTGIGSRSWSMMAKPHQHFPQRLFAGPPKMNANPTLHIHSCVRVSVPTGKECHAGEIGTTVPVSPYFGSVEICPLLSFLVRIYRYESTRIYIYT